MYELIETPFKWVMTYGRPLEKALFNYVYKGKSVEDVLSALSDYQNEDGGFAHGLEPDFWTPISNPIDTWTAISIMRICKLDASHPMIQSTLRYLEKTPYQEKGYYYFSIPSNNDYPHAPWWHFNLKNPIAGVNPTAALVGFVLTYGQQKTSFYDRSKALAKQIVEDFIAKPEAEMHALRCMIELYHDLKELEDVNSLKEALAKQVIKSIDTDSEAWFNAYTVRPSQLILSPKTPGYDAVSDLVNKEHDELMKRRNSEGIWDITWSWGQYEEQYKIAKRHWQSVLAFHYSYRLTHFDKQSV